MGLFNTNSRAKFLLISLLLWSKVSFSQGEDLFNSLRQETVKDESLIPKRMIFLRKEHFGEIKVYLENLVFFH